MKVLIVGELNENEISTTSLELVNKAKDIATEIFICTVGSKENVDVQVEGLNCTYIKIDENILSTHSIANAIKEVASLNSIEVILVSSTYLGRDIAAFLSVDYDSASVTNVTDINACDTFSVTTAINGGKELYITDIESDIKIVVVRPKSFEPLETIISKISDDKIIDIKKSELDVQIQKINIEEKSGPQLEDSSLVISAGRGLGEASNLNIINELASKLDAAVGATRAIVDAGWVPYSHQVGQTGKTVKPDIYIACGISGATQHQVGMKDSKFIIAINKDEDAPIFQIADLGIVGDVHQVIPKLISLIYNSKEKGNTSSNL